MQIDDAIRIYIERISHNLGESSHFLLGALAIFVVGTFSSWIVSFIFILSLKKLKLSKKIQYFSVDQPLKLPIEALIGRVVFYVLWLFVLVATFQTLGLTLITEPLNKLLNQIFMFLPRLLGSLGILGVAWLSAHLSRIITRSLVVRSGIEEKWQQEFENQAAPSFSLSENLGEFVYWLIFLLFLPAFLQTVGMKGLLEPIQGLVHQILNFAPRIAAALFIVLVGWFSAKVIQRLVSQAVYLLPLNRLTQHWRLPVDLPDTIAKTSGLVLYVLILIPTLISALQALQLHAITEPASQLLKTLFAWLPILLSVGFILGLSYFVSLLLKNLTLQFLQDIQLDTWLAQYGFKNTSSLDFSISKALALGVQTFLLLFAMTEAFRLLHLLTLANVLNEFTHFLVQVVTGLGIFAAGLWIAHIASHALHQQENPQARLLGFAAKCAIWIVSGAMALRHMGLAQEIVVLAFGGIVASLTISFAIAVGLGGKTYVAAHAENWVSHWFTPTAVVESKTLSEHHFKVTKTLLDIQESERTQTAFTLGTELEKELTSIAIQLAASSAAQDVLPALYAAIDKLKHTADQVRPAILDEIGLSAAIETVLNQWETEGALVQMSLPENSEAFSYIENTQVYRLFECLKNFLKQGAQANKIYVRLEKHVGGIELEIRENGTFYTVEQLFELESRAALELSERLRILSANIEIKNQGNTNFWRIHLSC